MEIEATKTPLSKPTKKQVRFDFDNTIVHEIPALADSVFIRLMFFIIDLFALLLRKTGSPD